MTDYIPVSLNMFTNTGRMLEKPFKYAAFFDLDRTIFNVNSATSLVQEARQRNIMSIRLLSMR